MSERQRVTVHFFENARKFSFGDYFKEEAIQWTWEFLTEVVGLDPNRLYPSVYEDDAEAFEIWNKKMGIPAERIFKFGKADNFWEHGSGPCGPCSEVYYDRGEKYGCGSPDCTVGCECDRYMEIWNNVFTQFDNDGNGNYSELEQKNIDTGMGLERLACVVQDVDSMFDVDTIRDLREHVCRIAGKEYGKEYKTDVSVRVITDHIRSVTFMISDGILLQQWKRLCSSPSAASCLPPWTPSWHRGRISGSACADSDRWIQGRISGNWKRKKDFYL